MRLFTGMAAAAASLLVGFAGCSSQPSSSSAKSEQDALAKEKAQAELTALRSEATATIDRAKRDNPAVQKYFESSVGYVVFPTIAKGGLGIGAAHGDGVVYEHRSMLPDKVIGTAEVTQVTVGLQIGGQTFSEIIFFEDAATFDNFKKSNVEFDAAATGVAGGEGGSAVARYESGVAVFVFGEKGFMGEASIGGQKFKYKALGA